MVRSPSSRLSMGETVGVVVATFGDWEKWYPIGQRAVASIKAQTRPPDLFCWPHGETLAEARNFGAKELGTEWLIFLDADDELDPGYIEAMLAVGEGDIRRPATLGVYEDGTQDDAAVMIPRRDIDTANFIVIGAMCRRELFLAAGGFPELPILEDWACWRKMIQAGATVVDVPDAIYRVTVSSGSRNQDHRLHATTYRLIRDTNPM